MRKDWEVKKLGDLSISLKNGLTIKQDKSGCGIPVTRIETLSNGVFNRDKLGYANIYDKEQYCDYILDDKDLLISHINSKKYVGRTVLYRKAENESIIHGMNLLRLKLNNEFTLPEFIVYYFKASYIKEQIRKYRKDAVNQSSISITDINKIRLFVPPLQTQQQIVEELDCLTSIIEKQKKQLEELDNLAQAIFYDMFGDPIENEKGWEVKKLGDVCKTSSGGTPSKKVKEYFCGNILWLRSGEIKEMYLYDTEIKISNSALHNSNAKIFPVNTVVIAMYGATVGQVGILKNEMATNQAVCGISSNKIISEIYLYYSMKERRNIFLSAAKGGGQPNISQSIIRNTFITIPPLSLQQQFASKIESIEKQKELIKKSIKETEDLFNSRMDYYFN